MDRKPLTIIAEVAQGYEGNPTLAKLLIKGAAASGADAVKFQVVFADDVAVPDYQYYPLYQTLQMPEEVWLSLKALAHQSGLQFYTDLSGEHAFALAQRVKPDAAKIHSGNFFNHRLVERILEAFPRVLVSTGGIQVDEIERFIARHRVQRHAGQVAFLFGFQADPTPLDRNALTRLPRLMERLQGFEVGFMDHADGDGPDASNVSVMAQALGVRLFEKHLTLDRALTLEDYASALEPARFAQYVGTLRRLDAALGSPALSLNDAELAYRRKMVKKLLLVSDLPKGHVMAEADLAQKRRDTDGDGHCYDPDEVIGKRLARAVSAGEPLQAKDFQ
jgi:N,N'-diacetyllegionaminate synthase